MHVILGLSQISYDWTLRVSHGCKSSSWHRRAKEQANDIVSLSARTYAHNLSYQHVCRTCHIPAKIFTCDTRFLHAGSGSTGFFLTEVLFVHEPPESPIVGVSDIGQVSTAQTSINFKYFYLLKNVN